MYQSENRHETYENPLREKKIDWFCNSEKRSIFDSRLSFFDFKFAIKYTPSFSRKIVEGGILQVYTGTCILKVTFLPVIPYFANDENNVGESVKLLLAFVALEAKGTL